jgi:tetratricopeptide (TPR) repeat protein
MNKLLKKITFYTLFIWVLFVNFYIYSLGLSGDYVFDDSANILENTKIAINTLDWNGLKSAFLSGGAGPLGRPISMLTFALNHYFTGFNPFYFKLTNLIIHSINGILVYFLILQILKKLSLSFALSVSFIWLVHPLNLTSVLYVVQRMTSLSTLFGLIMLVVYCFWRNANNKTAKFTFGCFSLIFISLLFSIYSKESGILFVGLLYWIELIIYQGRKINKNFIYIGNLKLINLLWIGVAVGVIGIVLIAIPYISNPNLGNRSFNTVERLLTESRIIFYYLKMIFFPLLSDFSLYHDDFSISKSVTQPITTLYSLVALLFITLASFLFYKKYPLVLFAWGWYVISQLLESTFISLELVHEHRNYFGSIGFILLVVFIFTQINNRKIKMIASIITSVYIANIAFTTWQRAQLWSNLVDQAAYEVSMHPKSDRANYQMARIYMKLMNETPVKKEIYAEKAYYYLEQSKNSYMPSNGAWFGEMHLASEMRWDIDLKNIDELKMRLANSPFSNSNIGFLSAFVDCQTKKYCQVPHEQAVLIIAAGIDNPNVSNDVRAELYKLLANYFVSIIADYAKGEEFMFESLKLKNDINAHLILSQIFRAQKKYDQSLEQIKEAQNLDHENIWYKEIENELSKVNKAKT